MVNFLDAVLSPTYNLYGFSDGGGLQREIGDKIVKALLDVDGSLMSKVIELREMDDPNFQNHKDFFVHNVGAFGVVNRMKTIVFCNNPHTPNDIGATFGDELDLELPQVPLFSSFGAISVIGEDGIIHTSYDDKIFDENGLKKTEEVSGVARAYGPDKLKRMSLEKAKISRMIHDLLPLFKYNVSLQTSILQAIITILSNDNQYYRGPYFNNGNAYGVSGCYISHEMIGAICDGLGIDKEIMEDKHCLKNGENVGKVDLLAGIFDELLSKLVAHDESEWDNIIRSIAREIKFYAETGEIEKLC